ncbi:hypothetical protein TREMEDRAFT_29053 [Tremella mesenterica DSM 1558]|uniref:uncharacterized protein n=1 Tax=Tremella mesenterica (strain ATCC 24925 / CBS 8224 / DSM 1558 / NBRC 9311 / NRRL Y-6157 / RJB 2259-6 / UBC 559-6) TaxID=578456 RepID=UPI0003F48C5F|nr:uncharacterized protein TREMEDRAFT_29053 [Tremella mesenterica DSM 1558]EIW70512.1 hypothetical protein TREMEDRAFT_29053 [Tremella mesenterica DSM 1558]
MAILTDIPSSSSSIRHRPQLPTSPDDIPLIPPSTIRSSSTKPLINLSPPPSPQIEGQEEIEEKDDEKLSAFWDEIFDSFMLTVPFSFLYLLLDILVHLQYNHRPKLQTLTEHMFTAVPTSRHADHWLTRGGLIASCIASGCRLIWLVNKAGWSLTTEQAPAMGTIWILTIIQLPLSRGLLSLVVIAIWVKYTGMNIYP